MFLLKPLNLDDQFLIQFGHLLLHGVAFSLFKTPTID